MGRRPSNLPFVVIVANVFHERYCSGYGSSEAILGVGSVLDPVAWMYINEGANS